MVKLMVKIDDGGDEHRQAAHQSHCPRRQERRRSPHRTAPQESPAMPKAHVSEVLAAYGLPVVGDPLLPLYKS